ncbi:ATP-binding protein [Streptomyces varsoviensis]|uniref:ATP-binding protein n=1 Tax=Streptomyces varsoviensis TaxID=67373 RepID=UPI0033D21724
MGVCTEPPSTHSVFTPSTPAAPKICRDFVRSVLAASELDQLAEVAVLCTSELVTNVHQHADGDVLLVAAVEPAYVRIEVHDEGPGLDRLPTPRRAESGDTHGRGLFLVYALADLCGVTAAAVGRGKGVWFQLNLPAG